MYGGILHLGILPLCDYFKMPLVSIFNSSYLVIFSQELSQISTYESWAVYSTDIAKYCNLLTWFLNSEVTELVRKLFLLSNPLWENLIYGFHQPDCSLVLFPFHMKNKYFSKRCSSLS